MNTLKLWSLKALALAAFLVAGVTTTNTAEAASRWGVSVYGDGYGISYSDYGRHGHRGGGYYGRGYGYNRGYYGRGYVAPRYVPVRYGYRDYRPYYRDYGYYAPGYYYNAPYSYYNVSPSYDFYYYDRGHRGHRHHGHRGHRGHRW